MERTSSFGYWLRRRRKALDLTQGELAQRVGCAVGTIKKLETDERRPSKQLAERLADLLQIPPDERVAFLKVARAELATDQLETVQLPIDRFNVPTTNLPASGTPFIGREREVATLRNLIRRNGVRLVTLSGPGGIGKTRLGLQVAAEVLDLFAYGVWFVNLAAVRDPTLVAATIAQTLGVRESGDQPMLEVVKRYLRDKSMLLFLDNFEQIVEAAPLVSELLACAPSLKVLVTSRTTLRLSDEHEYVVPPLGVPPPLEPPHDPAGQRVHRPELEHYESVRLFVERAQAVKGDFILTDENADAVADICRRLDGLPLAITLAAARVKLFSPPALLARLDSRLGLLTGGARDLPARQQTIRATIDWSYNLLDAGEQGVFAHLGVFVGGWTIEAAEAVAASDGQPRNRFNLLEQLASLVDKSMIFQLEGTSGEPRFAMLGLIREYALERLEERGEGDALRRRHAEYYLSLAERWWREDNGNAEAALFDLLEQEHENVRAALDWSHVAADGAVIELRLMAALSQFFAVRGYFIEGWERLKAGLLRRGTAPDWVRARALRAVGSTIPHYRGDLQQMNAFIEEGLALDTRLKNTDGVAWQIVSFGLIAGFQGDYQRARELFGESQALYQSLNDTWGQSVTHFASGQVAFLENDLERAAVLLEQSLELCRASINVPWATARRLTVLGAVLLAQGQHVRARNLFKESLALSRDSRDKVDIPLALVGMAGVAGVEGQAERAAYLLGAAEALSERFGATHGLIGEYLQKRFSATARAQLDPSRFKAAWTAGRALTLAQAIEVALHQSV